jgi:hypothetical protein
MTPDQICAEEEAVQSLMDLLAQAKKCRSLYERAHMGLPEPLKRVLGMSMNGTAKGMTVRPQMPPIERPSRPPEAMENWISIEAKEATPTGIALAILRASKEPVRARDVVTRVTEILSGVRGGSIANIGNRLEGKVIKRTKDGWTLIAAEKAGVLHNGYLWGPPAIFEKTELAAHRREAILHLLGCQPAGLQITQLVEQLHGCSWVHAPINKDLLKADMEVLKKADKARRRGSSKKWELAPTPKAGE